MSDSRIDGICPPIDFSAGQTLDAIIVPGNGLKLDGTVPEHIAEALDAAIKYTDHAKCVITTSRGSAHNEHPHMFNGKIVYEADAAKEYLVNKGIPSEKIIAETNGQCTLANAYFSRIIADAWGFKELLLIVSESRMPRAKDFFEWVFGLLPHKGYAMHYLTVYDRGLSADDVRALSKWGQQRMEDLKALKASIFTFDELTRYMYSDKYRQGTRMRPLPASLRQIYASS